MSLNYCSLDLIAGTPNSARSHCDATCKMRLPVKRHRVKRRAPFSASVSLRPDRPRFRMAALAAMRPAASDLATKGRRAMLKGSVGLIALGSLVFSGAAVAQEKIKVGVTATLEGTYTVL